MQVSNHDIINKVIPADVANAATFNVVLPAGKTSGIYNGSDHRMSVPAFGGEQYFALDGKIGVSFSSPSIATITNNTGRTLPKDALVYLQFDKLGLQGELIQTLPERVRLPVMAAMDLGTPLAALPNGIATSQAVTSASQMVLTVTTLDVPRALVGAWTGAAVCTVRGRDEFGQAMVEQSPSGVVFTGKKAFATVERITFSANVTAATFGWGLVLGLPLFLADKGSIARVVAGGVSYTDHNNDFIVAVTTVPTSSSGDVRGTFTPTSPIAPNGVLSYTVLVNAEDLYFRGRTQYSFKVAGDDVTLPPPANLDLDLTDAATTALLTTTRASVAYADNLGGVWSQFAANQPRITNKGLLVEEARTNSIRNNSMTGAAAGTPGTLPTNWGLSATGLTRTIVGTGTENGIDYLDLRLSGTTGSTFMLLTMEATNNIAATNSQVWSEGLFLALVGGSLANITSVSHTVRLYDSGAVFISQLSAQGDIKASLTSTMQRFGGPVTLNQATVAFVTQGLGFGYASGVAIDITLRIGWPQLELGAFVTSPIRTTTVAATRAADVVTIPSPTWINQTTGTMFADGSAASTAVATGGCFQIDTGASTDRHLIAIDGPGDNAAGTTSTGGVSQSSMTALSTANTKVAMAYAANDEAFCANGGTVVTDATVTLPAGLTAARLGTNGSVSWSGTLRRVSYWPSRLTNAQLQLVTTP